MAGPLARLYATLGLDAREFVSGIKGAQSTIGGFGTTASAGLRVAGAAIGGGLAFAAKGALEMEERAAQFQAQTGASAEEARHFADELNAMAGRSLVAMDDLAGAMTMIRTDLGLSGAEADAAATQFERYMRATGQGAEAVSAYDDILDAWNLTAADSQAIMDTLIAGQQEYGGTLTESQDILAKLAPALQAANMGWQDGTEFINLFNAAGVDATAAVTGITKALTQVKSPDELKALLADISATEDPFLRAEKAADLFGARAGVKLAQALQAADGDLSQFGFTLDEVTGKTEEAADALDDTLTSKFKLFLNQATSLIRGLGMELGPMLTGAMSAVWLAQSIGLGKFFGPMGVKAAGLFSAAFGVVQKGLSSLFMGMGGLADKWGAFMGGRFGLAFKVGAIAAVVLLWAEVWNQYNQFQEKVAGAQKDLAQKAAGAATQAGEDAITNLGNTVKTLGSLQGFDRMLADTFAGKESLDALRNLGTAILADSSLTAAQIEQAITNLNAAAVEAQARGNQAIADELRGMAETLSMREPIEAAERGASALGDAIAAGVEKAARGLASFEPPEIAGPIEDEFAKAKQAILAGFGSVKEALKKGSRPQLISRDDRLENMAKRQRRVQKQLNAAVAADDPWNQRYWEGAKDKIALQMARLSGDHAREQRVIQRASGNTADKAIADGQRVLTAYEGMDLSAAGQAVMATWAAGIAAGVPAALAEASLAADLVRNRLAAGPRAPGLTSGGGGTTVNVNAGVLVADDKGIDELGRRMDRRASNRSRGPMRYGDRT